MIRFFAVYILGAILSAFAVNSYAESNLGSIVKNKEVSACAEKNGDNDSECFAAVSKLTEKKLNTVYQDKLKEISNYDYSQWWMGEKKTKGRDERSFYPKSGAMVEISSGLL